MKQLQLISEPHVPSIPGLRHIPDYLSPASEAALLVAIYQEKWDTTWERRRQIYGQQYGSSKEARRAIPDWGQVLALRIFEERLVDRPFDQMVVNEYLPGQGIALHCDYEPFDRTVVSVSLLSACVMQFRRIQDGATENLLLARRSLLILEDEARYGWQHGIARRKKDTWQGQSFTRSRRLSITLRRTKQAHA